MNRRSLSKRTLPLIIVSVFAITGCAEPIPIDPAFAGQAAGFLKGLFHGFILLFAFIVSLFRDDVAVYAANNTGALYDLGYLLGVMIFFGGGGNRTRR